MDRSKLEVYHEDTLDKCEEIVKQYITDSESIYVALKSDWQQYLICTDRQVYIIKKGFATGHTFGEGIFKMPYANISNAGVEFHVLTGYFVVSAGGMENKPTSYWGGGVFSDKKSALEQPNTISMASDKYKNEFIQAANLIMKLVAEAHRPMEKIVQKSPAEQIKEYKELLDMDIITPEEFQKKKKELLGI